MDFKREIIPYTTEEAWLAERKKDLTSSDVASLFGVGYASYEELFQAKLYRKEVQVEENERMLWGKALQGAIASEFARRNSWTIKKRTSYTRIKTLRIGSSFDYEISHEYQNESPYKNEILEIKNIDSLQFKNNWRQDFEIEATPYIELQIQHQFLVSGLESGYLGVLIGGCQGIILKRKANPKIQQAILQKAAAFWGKIDEVRNESIKRA